MPEPTEPRKQYSDQQYRIIATHPETGENVQVINTKFTHSLSAVCAALGTLGIPFRQEKAN